MKKDKTYKTYRGYIIQWNGLNGWKRGYNILNADGKYLAGEEPSIEAARNDIDHIIRLAIQDNIGRTGRLETVAIFQPTQEALNGCVAEVVDVTQAGRYIARVYVSREWHRLEIDPTELIFV